MSGGSHGSPSVVFPLWFAHSLHNGFVSAAESRRDRRYRDRSSRSSAFRSGCHDHRCCDQCDDNTETNSSGYYRAEALVPGTYRAHFGAKGFASLDVTAIEVPAAHVIRLNTKAIVRTNNPKSD